MAAENPKIMQVILKNQKNRTNSDNLANFSLTFSGFRMPWLGQKDNMIDRFDARAHLDHIPPPPIKSPEAQEPEEGDEASSEERMINYERYRVLAQNDFLGEWRKLAKKFFVS
jgi:Alternative splicing regulator